MDVRVLEAGEAASCAGYIAKYATKSTEALGGLLYRKQITARLVNATTGAAHNERLPRMTVVQKGAHAATRPVTALVGVTRRAGRGDGGRQESALAGTEPATAPEASVPRSSTTGVPVALAPLPPSAGAGANGNGHGGRAAPGLTAGDPLSASGPAANGAHPVPGRVTQWQPSQSAPNGHGPTAAASARAAVRGHGEDGHAELTPRASHEDVMRRARELRDRARAIGLGEEEPDG